MTQNNGFEGANIYDNGNLIGTDTLALTPASG